MSDLSSVSLPRIDELKQTYRKLFLDAPSICIRSPGRAEIIGNHTDYNGGLALGCAIAQSVVVLASARENDQIIAISDCYPDQPFKASISQLKDQSSFYIPRLSGWERYLCGVISEFLKLGVNVSGFTMLLHSTVPQGGGVSSSAALEIAVAMALQTLYKTNLTPLEIAVLCQSAENGPWVRSPCGLLDQATVALSKEHELLLFDFYPLSDQLLKTSSVKSDLQSSGLEFVLSIDPAVKRNLGESGYPARRKTCEAGLQILEELLGRRLSCLREVTVDEFTELSPSLEKQGGLMIRKRTEHVIHESARVASAAVALQQKDFSYFGRLLSLSGQSALELYEVDEGTPELTFLVHEARLIQGVLGTRNMGGGFAAVTLSLIKTELVKTFEAELTSRYAKRWGRELEFISFHPSQGAEVL